jgi:glycosyltransferase involved in cell wall biosynthesis
VQEAIDSVLGQTWPDVQLIVVDDASDDDSASVIQRCVEAVPAITFLRQDMNTGNCRAFNRGLAFAQGDYIIDLAADDVLLPDRVQKGVEALTGAGDACGVNFTDAEWIGEDGGHLYTHSDRFPHASIPRGDVYRELVRRYFICSPTMMFRRSVIETLHGYDEALAYEDFDFWIRSSRMFAYCYTPDVLVKKRVVKNSMSERQFSFRDAQLASTFRVCEKIMSLNRERAEQQALAKRLLYEMRVCLRLFNFSLAAKYAELYFKNARLKY